MRVFVTGASGYLGSAVVHDLIAAGHAVTGLVRSSAAADWAIRVGCTPVIGELQDPAVLRAGSRDADAVAHLGWAAPGAGVDPIEVDAAAIRALGDELAGSGRRLVVTGGVLGLDPGRVVAEADRATDRTSPVIAGREASDESALQLVDRDVAPVLIRLAPSVHDDGRIKPGFAGRLVEIARAAGSAGYPQDGAMRWSAVHRLDAARLFRLALEQADAGTVLHGVAEEGVSQLEIAHTIAAGLDVATESLSAEDASRRFGWLAPLVALDAPASSSWTRASLGWTPAGPGLLEDLRNGVYFHAEHRP